MTLDSERQEPGAEGGLFEAAFGVSDAIGAIRYWQRFGYRAGPTGRLDAAEAKRLYGVDSDLTSVRLHHQDADHGLVRLMVWDKPTGEGLAMTPFRALGSLWTGTRTADIYTLGEHAEALRAQGAAIKCVPPFFESYAPPGTAEPFFEALPGVREMAMVRPLWRQAFIQLVGFDLPLYGHIDPACLFRTSQFTHCCLVIQDDSRAQLAFYDQVLGLARQSEVESAFEESTGGRLIFNLEEGENFHVIDFDDPRSTNAPEGRRSGRLKIIRFNERSSVADHRDDAGPGRLGLGFYTLRVRALEAMRERVLAAKATEVSAVVPDEFGRPACSIRAPDGCSWTLIGA